MTDHCLKYFVLMDKLWTVKRYTYKRIKKIGEIGMKETAENIRSWMNNVVGIFKLALIFMFIFTIVKT
jgi:hypothetical protein